MAPEDDAPALAGDRGGDGPTSCRQSTTRARLTRPPLPGAYRGIVPPPILGARLRTLPPGAFRAALLAELWKRAGTDASWLRQAGRPR